MSVSNEVLLDVQGLEKAYGGNQVLNGITTQIRRGEVVAIIGPSGCGKSTFLRSLNLLEEPTGGKILFEGTDITSRLGSRVRIPSRALLETGMCKHSGFCVVEK